MSLKIEKYFDAETMSVHLREKCKPMAKKGLPGNWRFEEVSKETLTAKDLKAMADEILDAAETLPDSFIDTERENSTIAQIGRLRIVIVRPPLGDGWEITIVRPIKQLKLADYAMSEKLKNRIAEQAEGIIIAGAPGQGKSTFAQALAEHYADQQKIVKTIETPRDLVLPDSITQLALSRGSSDEVHDILLLSRPDYTVYDEMRKTPDFALFADLRLAGVGMVGVLHATCPTDAIQRFIGKIELGMIPHVLDTVVFIKGGAIEQVLSVGMVVKVPNGMTEADLARPVVVISDFEKGTPVAEIYSYGEETVVVPVVEEKQHGAKALAGKSIERAMQRYSGQIKVEVVSDNKAVVYVPESYIAGIIGREGKNIQQIEKDLGIGLDIRALEEQIKEKPVGKPVSYETDVRGNYMEFYVDPKLRGKDVNIYVNDEYLATFAVGKKGVIGVKRNNNLGKTLLDAIDAGSRISLTV
jgi:ATPase